MKWINRIGTLPFFITFGVAPGAVIAFVLYPLVDMFPVFRAYGDWCFAQWENEEEK